MAIFEHFLSRGPASSEHKSNPSKLEPTSKKLLALPETSTPARPNALDAESLLLYGYAFDRDLNTHPLSEVSRELFEHGGALTPEEAKTLEVSPIPIKGVIEVANDGSITSPPIIQGYSDESGRVEESQIGINKIVSHKGNGSPFKAVRIISK